MNSRKTVVCLQVLTNLLDTDDFKCKIGSLRVLREISVHPDIRRAITMMGGIEVVVVAVVVLLL